MEERRNSVYDPARDTFVAKSPEDGATSEHAIADDDYEDSNQNGPKSTSKRKRSDDADTSKTKASRADAPSKDAGSHASKRMKPEDSSTHADAAPPPAITAKSLSSITRVKKAPSASGPRKQDIRRRSRSPVRRERRDSPPRRRDPLPDLPRSPTPPRSPPRQRKRPGASARINADTAASVRRRQEERTQAEQTAAREEAVRRGVGDVVTQHYNAVPQRGRQWRQTDSRIKGLRSFNNWVKSAIIQKFSPDEGYVPGSRDHGVNGNQNSSKGLLVLDIGCGKGGDLQKWQSAPQRVELYVGFDPADVSIAQAKDRFVEMTQKNKRGYRPHSSMDAQFYVRDCFGEWLGHVPVVRQVGIDPNVGPDGQAVGGQPRHGGFDVVTTMFCMHYAFENEQRARGMLKNVAGALKKGGRFIGVIPNSDVLSAKVVAHAKAQGDASPGVAIHANGQSNSAEDGDDDWDPEKPAASQAAAGEDDDDDDDDDWDPEKPAATPKQDADNPEVDKAALSQNDESLTGPVEWGNTIYRVKFPGKVPKNGVFKPNWGWKYFYFLEEAVEEIPEYVVPWEGFRFLASQYDLELQYRKPFNEVWDAEKNDPILGPLSERMGVRGRDRGRLLVSDEEMEAASKWIDDFHVGGD